MPDARARCALILTRANYFLYDSPLWIQSGHLIFGYSKYQYDTEIAIQVPLIALH